MSWRTHQERAAHVFMHRHPLRHPSPSGSLAPGLLHGLSSSNLRCRNRLTLTRTRVQPLNASDSPRVRLSEVRRSAPWLHPARRAAAPRETQASAVVPSSRWPGTKARYPPIEARKVDRCSRVGLGLDVPPGIAADPGARAVIARGAGRGGWARSRGAGRCRSGSRSATRLPRAAA